MNECKCATPHPKVGDRVAVIRDEHGWHDGRVIGTIIDVHHMNTARIQYVVKGDDGIEYYPRRTGDIRRI